MFSRRVSVCAYLGPYFSFFGIVSVCMLRSLVKFFSGECLCVCLGPNFRFSWRVSEGCITVQLKKKKIFFELASACVSTRYCGNAPFCVEFFMHYMYIFVYSFIE